MSEERHIVVGAGPTGLTAAWHLAREGRRVLVIDKEPDFVGGLARTVEFKGHRFDIGPHRFYTKSDAILAMWREMLPEGLITLDRLTRIYHEKRFYSYPIKIRETMKNLGMKRSLKFCTSYLHSRLAPIKPVKSFEDWVVNAFGRELYRTFFKTYSEKVWGMPCSQIDKDWAAQRIRGLSMLSAVRNALFGSRGKKVKSLVERFLYPETGAGRLWTSVLEQVLEKGGELASGKDVNKVRHEDGRMLYVESRDGDRFEGSHFYLTMPLRDLVGALDPAPPEEVLAAGRALGQRDFMIAALLVHEADLFPDQWIYIHDEHVKVARISNFENWQKGSHGSTTRLACEYFSNREDELWNREDGEILDLAVREVKSIGLVKNETRVEGFVVRVPNAYPVYDCDYRKRRETVKAWMNASFRNAIPAGRGGLHNYNSQDHAMMSGVLSVKNMLHDASFDVWSINTEHEYAEEKPA
jgi:protoporphyrinogen oxidase